MSTPQYIYVMKDLRKVVPPNREILKGIWLSFFPGAKIGVVGANGAGKSSLLRIMAGVDTEFQGEAWAAKGTRVGYVPQEPQLDAALDVRGNVELAVQPIRDLLRRFDEVNLKFAEPMSDDEMTALIDEQARLQDAIDAAGAWELDRKIEIAMDALRLPPGDADVTRLSGGEKRRVALCRTLLEEPDLLLLDEPTNHLDAESVAWLEHHLAAFKGTVVAITHDRYFLDNVAEWILELDRGEGIPWKGNYSSWLEQKQDRLKKEEKAESAKQRTLQRELEWIRMAPRARHAKSKARLTAYEDLASQDAREKLTRAEIVIPTPARLGEEVVNLDNVAKGYGDNLLFENLELRLPRGGIVGVIGPNGAGKTTLFRLMTRQETPDAGSVQLGQTVQLAYVDQSRDSLDPDRSVWEEISGKQDEIELGRNTRVNSRAYCSWFGFKGGDQQKKVGTLSGGERNRVHLAKLLRSGGNVILLDEPTNDLDVDTLRALEDALLNFAGCAVVISHDRWFLDRIATHILAFEGESRVVFFEGNYQEYEVDRKRRLGAEAEQPHRIKYRRPLPPRPGSGPPALRRVPPLDFPRPGSSAGGRTLPRRRVGPHAGDCTQLERPSESCVSGISGIPATAARAEKVAPGLGSCSWRGCLNEAPTEGGSMASDRSNRENREAERSQELNRQDESGTRRGQGGTQQSGGQSGTREGQGRPGQERGESPETRQGTTHETGGQSGSRQGSSKSGSETRRGSSRQSSSETRQGSSRSDRSEENLMQEEQESSRSGSSRGRTEH